MYNIIRLSEQLSEKHIVIHSSSTSAEDILREMVQKLSDEFSPDICEEILNEVFAREKVRSTGIGHGIAIPHARTALVKQLYCAAATSESGIEYNALDGKPVSLFFLIISPDFTVGPHLNILSAISHLVSKKAKLSSELNDVETPSEFMDILKETEERYII
ncbi:MAG: PTS sugar transporter subunit IIA [Fibromonadaceae bacterium]|jgi:mannitol/fructose-specific phosphotransferase system IIA component (Ntr-type)|nr:PTS sugar transporter subunit IIA [Fibromonadaceae bacterium]